jgi:hypothetical protein
MTVKLRARGAARLLLAAAALAPAGRAAAHPEFSALGTNRYVTAAVFEGRVDVTDALLEGTLASGEERKRLDADGDGRITEAELRAAEDRLRAEGPALTVDVDGRTLSAPWAVSIDVGDDGGATTSPVVVERRASFPQAWPAGARHLRLVVAREPPRVIDTEIGVVLGPGLALVADADLFTFRGARASALEERAATFEIVSTAPPKRRPVLPAAAAGLGALVLAAVVLRLRKARGQIGASSRSKVTSNGR